LRLGGAPLADASSPIEMPEAIPAYLHLLRAKDLIDGRYAD
jgi:hypothetical protein